VSLILSKFSDQIGYQFLKDFTHGINLEVIECNIELTPPPPHACLNLIVQEDRNCQNCLTLKSFVSVNHINTLGDLFDCKLIQTSRVKNAIIFSPIILRGYYGPSILPHQSLTYNKEPIEMQWALLNG